MTVSKILPYICCTLEADKTRGTKVARKMRKRNAKTAARVQHTAELTGYGTDYVYKVINGERENEEIMQTYMMLYEGENKLLQSVKELLPFE